MAGLALLIKSLGWQVDGCDASTGPLLSWLNAQGIATKVGHAPAHLNERPVAIVRSPAVAWTDPELVAALEQQIPVIDRGRLLPALLGARSTVAVAGTHGKTTTASMIAWCLARAGHPVSYCIGGVCPGLDAVARIEPEGWVVVEADESDGTLRHYHPKVGVVTALDLDHVDYYADESALHSVYHTFVRQSDLAIVPAGSCGESGWPGTRVITFGEATASVQAAHCRLDAGGSDLEVAIEGGAIIPVRLGVPGRHNILNALAAWAALRACGLPAQDIAAGLSTFRLPRRRFETVIDAAGIRIISDYAHHPVEIKALIDQAKLLAPRRLIAVFQPHRYSRTRAFSSAFINVLAELDLVVLAPVYSASEPFIEGGTSADVHAEAVRRGCTRIHLADSLDEAWIRLRRAMQPGDLVLIIGAGDVDRIGPWAANHVLSCATTINKETNV